MKDKYETPRVTKYGDFEDITKQGEGEAEGKGSADFDANARLPEGQA